MIPIPFGASDLERLVEEARPFALAGKVATYIPELARGNPGALSVALMDS